MAEVGLGRFITDINYLVEMKHFFTLRHTQKKNCEILYMIVEKSSRLRARSVLLAIVHRPPINRVCVYNYDRLG